MAFPVPAGPNQTISGYDILYHGIARGATLKSAERFPAPRCHPHTRSAILDDISEWIAGGNTQILWLCGSLGSGKTAIAQTIAERCQKSEQLGSSFFFAREREGRDNAQAIFPTMAAELTAVFPETRRKVEEAIEYDPSLLTKSLDVQFEKILLGPFRTIDRRMRKLVLIDALDECKDGAAQCRVLQLIASSVEQQRLPFCFLIASRPEPHIREVLDQGLSHFCRKIDLDSSSADADIGLYLRDSLRDITKFDHLRRPMHQPWPGEDVLSKMIAHASGQFLYASLIVRFVREPYWFPSDRLKIALGYEGSSVEAFKHLDQLYAQILSRDPDPGRLLKVLGAILLLREPPHLAFLIRLLSLGSVDISLSLRPLHSVLQITTNNPIRVRHQSFSDFLQDRARSGPFYIDATTHHSNIARYCLQVLQDTSDPEYLFGLKHWCYHCSKSDDELLKNLQKIDLSRWLDWSAKQNPGQDDFPLVADRLQTSSPPSSSRQSLHDSIILQILHGCHNKKVLLQVLGVLAVARRPLLLSEVVDISNLPEDIVLTTLCEVNPLVHISSSSLDSQWCIRFESFASFLTTRRRAGEFFIKLSAQHRRLTLRCLDALKADRNTPAMFFAMDDWTFHLSQCPTSRKVLGKLRTVSTENASREIEVAKILSWLKRFYFLPRGSIKRWQTYGQSLSTETEPEPKVTQAGLFSSIADALGLHKAGHW